jgi:hypothetical protein
MGLELSGGGGSGGGVTLPIAESDVTNLVSDLAAKVADNAVVHLTGAESVAGSKTFTDNMTIVSGDNALNLKSTNASAPDIRMLIRDGSNNAAVLIGYENTSSNFLIDEYLNRGMTFRTNGTGRLTIANTGESTFSKVATFIDDGIQIKLKGSGSEASRIQFYTEADVSRAYIGYGSATGQTFRIACNNAGGVFILETGGNEIIKTDGTYLQFQVVPTFNTGNSTGAGTALLGSNSPAVTLTAPYTWFQVTTSDGSTGYIPVWK